MKVFHRRAWRYGHRATIVGVVIAAVVLAGGGAVFARLGGFGTASSSGDIDLQKGLVGWWKLDGNAKDATPYAENLTATNATVTADRKGITSSAYSLNGTSTSWLANNTVTKLPNPSTALTLSIWFKANTVSGIQDLITISNRSTAGDQLRLNGTSLSVNRWNTSQLNGFPNANLVANTWYLATYTYDGTTSRVYLNGALVGSSTDAVQNGAVTSVVIGNYNTSGGLEPFAGSLDDARVYKRTLSAAEVTALYQGYNPSIGLASGEKGLVGWWKLDGNAKDATPYSDNGILSGATATADRKGTASSALNFDGNSNYATIPNASELTTNSVTVSFWAKLTTDPDCDANNNWRAVMSKGDGAYTTAGWDVVMEENKLVQFDVGYGGVTHRSGTVDVGLQVGSYTLLTFTFNASTGAYVIYSNGAAVASGNYGASAIGSTSLPLSIARGGNTGSCPDQNGFFPGSIDDLRLYNRALSASEVTSIYSSYNSQINLQSSPSGSATANLNSGLVAYWPFNGNAKDATPYQQTGVSSGSGVTMTTDRKGRANSAYAFNGTDYILASPWSNLTGSANRTVAVWFKTSQSSTGGATRSLVVWGGPNAGDGSSMKQYNGTIGFDVGSCSTAVSETSYINGQWHLAVATLSSGTVTLYLDGSNVASGTCTYTTASSSDVGIGASDSLDSSPPNQQFTGSLDDIHLYNRALSSTEVTALYNEYN
jgi:hypothetical protein